MRVGVFIDGPNFYRSLEAVHPELEVDYDRLAGWLVDEVGGPGARLVGAWYYTGCSQQPALERFLHGLELRPGYFVRRHRVVERDLTCVRCGASSAQRVEKGVDVRIAVDMVQRALEGQLDAAVLLSGDEDLVPAVELLQARGCPVWVGSWAGQSLSAVLRAEAWGHLDLALHVERFATGRTRAAEPRGLELDEAVLQQVRAAVDYFGQRGRPLSRWYFENRWGGEVGGGEDRTQRARVVERLLGAGQVEVFLADINGRRVEALRVAPEAAAAGSEGR